MPWEGTLTDYVRIRVPETKHEVTVTALQADVTGVKPLDKPAVDASGNPLPPKYHRSIEEAAAAGQKGA